MPSDTAASGRAGDIETLVLSEFRQVAQEQGKTLVELSGDVPLLETGLDSLCFAIVVVRLEDRLGYDPISDAQENIVFPVTVGDFVKLYQDAAAKPHQDAAR